jgi:hypothetical protein
VFDPTAVTTGTSFQGTLEMTPIDGQTPSATVDDARTVLDSASMDVLVVQDFAQDQWTFVVTYSGTSTIDITQGGRVVHTADGRTYSVSILNPMGVGGSA